MFKLFLFFLAYLPFQLALNPSAGIDLASIRVIILVFFLFWLAKGLKDKKIIIKNNAVTALVAAFLFLNVVSIAVSKNTDWSARKMLFLFSIFPVYFVASSLFSGEKEMEKGFKFMLRGGFGAALIGIVQFFSQFAIGLERTYKIWADFVIWPFLGKNFAEAVLKNPSWLVNVSGHTYLRATSLFPDPHMFSFFLGLLLPLSAGLAMRLKKPLYFLIFAVLLAADILTFSRGGYLGLFAGAFFMLFIFWRDLDRKYKIALILGAVIIMGTLLLRSPVSERFMSSFDLKEGSNSGRLEMWKEAGKIILENPLLGTGIGNYPLWIKPSANYREPIYVHNTYLDIAVETGVFNALIWMGILAASIFIFLKKSKKEILFLWPAVSLVIFSAHSLVETALYSSVVLPLLLIIISFSNIDAGNEKNI